MSKVLVVANETVGGRSLWDAVKRRLDAAPDTQFFLVVPQGKPRHGNVIYDDAVRDAAQVRVELAEQFIRQNFDATIVGEVGDTDPFNATLDAVAEWKPDEIIVSTHPTTSSGWLRRDLIERVEAATGLPVEHVVTDVAREGLVVDVTLVVANRTAGTPQLLDELKQRAKKSDGQRLFIVVVPQESGEGLATRAARARLSETLTKLREEKLLAAGFIADPDPFVATMNALQAFNVSDIVISTFAETRSGWLRADLIERVRGRTPVPVEHVASKMDESTKAA